MTPDPSKDAPYSNSNGLRNRRHERGSIVVWVALSAMIVISIMTYTIALGQAYLAKSQLQIAADAAARAAIDVIEAGGSKSIARAIARSIAQGTNALEGGLLLSNDAITFGDWNPASRNFTLNGVTWAPAVRVAAERTFSSPGGPIEFLLHGLLPNRWLEIRTDGTASAACREVIFVVDNSWGMQQEIDEAYQVVDEFMRQMRRRSLPGDKIGMVVFAGDSLSMRDYEDNGGPSAWGAAAGELSAIPLNSIDLTSWIGARVADGRSCGYGETDFNVVYGERLPTRGPGSCAGKGDQHGIEKAVQMFADESFTCSSPGERLIIFITSDTPCWVPSALVPNAFGRRFGGTFAEAYAAADYAYSEGISIQPILIDNGRNGNCPFGTYGSGQHQESPTTYINNMVRGSHIAFALIDPLPSEIRDVINRINDVIFSRIVE